MPIPPPNILNVKLFDHYKNQGQAVYPQAEQAKPNADRLDELQKAIQNEGNEKELVDANNYFKSLIDDTYIEINKSEYTDDKAHFQSVQRALYEAWQEKTKQIKESLEPQQIANRAERNKLQDVLIQQGNNFLYGEEGIVTQSPITPKQAEDWANAQVIGKNAVNQLKGLGYPVEQVRQDMAEFYRLTRGRLGNISIEASRKSRASAGGVESYQEGAVNLATHFNKKVLFHELGHHIEQDPSAKMAANGFLEKRKKKDSVVSLRKLTGNKGYRGDEVAYDDDFFSPYIGKKYPDGITEVFSMGLESFSSPDLLMQRMTQDPEMFALMTGFLKADINPLYTAMKAVYGQANEANKDLNNNWVETRAVLVKKLAKGVIIDDPQDEAWMDGLEWMPRFKVEHKAKYIGRYYPLRLFKSSNVRQPGTRKKGLGYDLVWGKTSDNSRAKGTGIAKIVDWHSEAAHDLQGFILSLHVHQRHGNKIHLTGKGGKRAAVQLDYNGKTRNWLLTAYVKGKGKNGILMDSSAAHQTTGEPDSATSPNTVIVSIALFDTANDLLTNIENAAHAGDFGQNPRRLPTAGQLAAGNYKKGRVDFHGLPLAIEQPRGTYRTGTDKSGQRWSSFLAANYGYVAGTKGADGDPVDCFVGVFPDADHAYVVNQYVNGQFDEHKIMLGFPDEQCARNAYFGSYERGWNPSPTGNPPQPPFGKGGGVVEPPFAKGGLRAICQ